VVEATVDGKLRAYVPCKPGKLPTCVSCVVIMVPADTRVPAKVWMSTPLARELVGVDVTVRTDPLIDPVKVVSADPVSCPTIDVPKARFGWPTKTIPVLILPCVMVETVNTEVPAPTDPEETSVSGLGGEPEPDVRHCSTEDVKETRPVAETVHPQLAP